MPSRGLTCFMNRCVMAVLLMLTAIAIRGQNIATWDDMLQQLADEAALIDDGEDLEAQFNDLNYLHENPFDINTATKADLLRLPFVSPEQADAILDFIARHGPVHDIGELLLARGIGQREVWWLKACAAVLPDDSGTTNTTPRNKPFSHELLTRLDIPFYQRQGWPWAQGIAHRLRYVARWQRWEAGFRGEKDSGEPMFTRDIPLWDAMGLYASLHDVGCLNNAVVGDYKVAFGEGLVINQGFGFGKMFSNLWRIATGVRPQRSFDELHFLRGAAATLQLARDWQLTAFGSMRRMDAVINADNTTNGVSTSGLHRTPSELSHRNALWSHTAGTHLQWHRNWLTLGATALWQHYDHRLVRGNALYRQIYPEGTHFGNVSIDYRASWSRFTFRGETARSFAETDGGWATLNRAALRLGPNMQLSAIQRFYSYQYYSAHARAFGENSRAQNESGICLAIDAERVGPFAINAYFDLFHSPWPRYTMTHASTGWEASTQAGWSPNRRHALTARYRIKNKERSDIRATSHTLRATYVCQLASPWTLSATAMLHRHHTATTNSTGYAIIPRIDYGSNEQTLAASLTAMLFQTNDFESRITLYEPSLLQTFGLLQVYGRGQRVAATLRLRLSRHVNLQAKLGVTHYSDRDVISSGPLLINSPWKSDASILLRIR